MPRFSGQHREYVITLTIGSAKRVKSRCGVDLLRPSGEHDGMPLVSALYTDIILFVDVLYVLCVSDEMAVTPEEFADDLPAQWQEVRELFYREWIDFFRRCGLEDKAATIKKQREAVQAALSESWTRLSDVDVQTHARQRMADVIDQIVEQNLRSTPGSKSTNSLDSSESTPAF